MDGGEGKGFGTSDGKSGKSVPKAGKRPDVGEAKSAADAGAAAAGGHDTRKEIVACEKGQGKAKGKLKGKLKGPLMTRMHDRDPFDWEEDDVPRLADRQQQAIQRQSDFNRIGQLRANANKRLKDRHEADPATFDRQWNVRVGLTSIENTTQSDWNVFISTGIVHSSALHDKKRLGSDFKFTQSYIVQSSTRKRLRIMSVLAAQKWVGSYRKMRETLLIMDVWRVSRTGFNEFLGFSSKSLYDIANDRVTQNVTIKPPNKRDEFDIGIFTLTATISEVLEFTIVGSNWQYAPRPAFQRDTTEKYLELAMPESLNGGLKSHQTDMCDGPRYVWGNAGVFTYFGTKVSLSMEAIRVSVQGSNGLQGKALVSLGSAIDYPIALGTVKALTKNQSHFVLGKVAGSLAITSRSVLLEEGVHDEHPSIAPPLQPADSLVLFYLTPKLQYLVVELYGADALPIADPDAGTSNPMCRVKFDGMTQQSEYIRGTTNPTWGQTFYLPVRLPDERLRTDRWFLENIMPIEMQSKGYLEFEIWHWDQVPTEFLGGCKFDPQETRICDIQQRAICQNKTITAKKPGEEDADEDIEIGIDPRLTKKYPTKVFATNKMRLQGSGIQGSGIATLSFQCYFIPDFPSNFAYLSQGDESAGKNIFADNFRVWEQVWPKFNNTYEAYFPDAPQARRFQFNFTPAGRDSLPLPVLVTPLALPASLATPLKVLHWVKCLQFTVPPKQRATGQITSWQQPSDTLAVHRGSVQDHAVLLSCALLGLGKHAFVCKGTLQGGKDHAWVMTREHGGMVTFWETTTGAKYHLPNRWLGDFTGQANNKAKVAARWGERSITQKWNDRDVVAVRQAMPRAQRLKSMDELEHIAIAPWPQFSRPEAVVVVPYESIEVVFNSTQLWGNVSNHHPSCIFYDMEHDPRSWLPLIGEVERVRVQEMKDIAIPVGPPISEFGARVLEDNIEDELKESLRLVRLRQGHETYFEEDLALQEVLEEFLGFLESECLLDSDWAFGPHGQLRRPWSVPSPFNASAYVGQCRQAWDAYWKRRQQICALRSYTPVKDNHILSGLPLHFSSVDLKEIRLHLTNCSPLLEYERLESDNCIFFVCAKVHPMPSTVASVWIFIGTEMPIPDDVVYAMAKEQQRRLQAQVIDGSTRRGKGWGAGNGRQRKPDARRAPAGAARGGGRKEAEGAEEATDEGL